MRTGICQIKYIYILLFICFIISSGVTAKLLLGERENPAGIIFPDLNMQESVLTDEQYHMSNGDYTLDIHGIGKDYKNLSDVGMIFKDKNNNIIKQYTVGELIKNPDKIMYFKNNGKWFYRWTSLENAKFLNSEKETSFTCVFADGSAYIFDLKNGNIIKEYFKADVKNFTSQAIEKEEQRGVYKGKPLSINLTIFGNDTKDFSDAGVVFKDEKSLVIKSYKISELVKDKTKIHVFNTYNIYQWIADKNIPVLKNGIPYLKLTVADGNVYMFNLLNGEISESYIDRKAKFCIPDFLKKMKKGSVEPE